MSVAPTPNRLALTTFVFHVCLLVGERVVGFQMTKEIVCCVATWLLVHTVRGRNQRRLTVMLPWDRFYDGGGRDYRRISQVARSLHVGVTHVVVDPDDTTRLGAIKERIRYCSGCGK